MATDVEWAPGPSTVELCDVARDRETDSPWVRRLLIGAVLTWFAMLILIPGVALVRKAFEGGTRPMFDALAHPEVHRAFTMSLGITAIATVVNTIFGVALAIES